MALSAPACALPCSTASPAQRIRTRPSAASCAARPAAAMAARGVLAAGRGRLGAAVASAWGTRGAGPAGTAAPGVPLRRLAPLVSSGITTTTTAAASSRGGTRVRAVADGGVAEAGAEVRKDGGYPFADIEARWQKHWADNKTFKTPDMIDTTKPKFYALDMFPYPRSVQLTVTPVHRSHTRSDPLTCPFAFPTSNFKPEALPGE